MKRLIALLALFGACSLAAPVIAQDKPATAAAEAKPAEAKPAAAKPAEAATAAPAAVAAAPAAAATATAAPAPVPNKGDTAWMIVATVLVILMTIPGLALFYGGLVRTKNMLSVLMQVFVTFCLISVLWVFYGYSIAFTEGNAFFGGFSRLFLAGMTPDSTAATFSKGVVIPEYIYVVFQLTFAAITPCLIVGSFAERMKFSAVLLFMALWFTFSYLPIAHMVWYRCGCG
jgi:Amt family ammonium transporter